MALPKQVQAQLAEIEEIEKTLHAQKEPKAEQPDDALDTEAEVTSETKQAVEPVKVTPTDTSPTDVEEETFKQKYKTLTGKYDAEVPRLHQQVKEMTEVTKQLQDELKALKVEPTKSKEKVSYVTDEDRAEFGEELIEVQRRVAKEVSQGYEDRFEQQEAVIKQLEDKLQQTGNQIGEVGFSQKLAQLVPDFAEVDKDERWIEWLNEHDPMLRGPRRDQAAVAFREGDAEAVAHYVSLWKQSITPAEVAPRDKRQAELEKQVTPSRSANSTRTQSAGQDQKVFNAKELQAGWDKIRILNTRGQVDEAAKLEAVLTAAYLEGRVRA